VTLGLVTWAALSAILLGYDVFPGRVSLRPGEPSPQLIRAPRMAEYVDREETERLREEAAARVPPQYSPLPYAAADAQKRLERTFDGLRRAQEARLPADAVQRALAGLSPEAAQWAAQAEDAELRALEEVGRAIIREVMSREIRERTGDVRAARDEAAALARERVAEAAAGELLAAAVSREVGPTQRYDEELTEAARAEARERVQRVVRTIEADHVIVFQGERVTRGHLAMLQAVGLASPGLDYRRTVAVGLIVGLIVILVGAQTRYWARPVYDSPKLLLLLSLLMVVSLFLVHLLTLSLPNVWMLFVPAAALIAAVLLGDLVAMSLALGASLLVGLMVQGGLPAALLSLGSASAALAFVSHIWPVSRLRWIVLALAVTNLALVAAIGLLQAEPLAVLARHAALASVLYSPGVAALSLGGIYLLQRPFGITTHLGLLELSNPQHPLLRQMQAEAPGTYYHSLMVADLADAAAEAVGADALLARVGSLYHDIGKLRRPAFFAENQALLAVENVHERLSSSLSGLIIISHVRDGVELAREHRLPPQIVEIVAQHHGASLASFFYQQALNSERPESVSEEQFRYPGPLPRTKEAALVMLADAVQAAAKSIAEPTPHRVRQMVRDIVRDRLVDGQLKECDLTFRDFEAAEAAMARVLTGSLCHTRVEYPEPVSAGPVG